MTNLRDYDRDATLIERVRYLERQLADAWAALDIAYAKGREDGRADGKHQIEQLRGLLRWSLVKFEAYQLEGYVSAPINHMRRIREELGDE